MISGGTLAKALTSVAAMQAAAFSDGATFQPAAKQHADVQKHNAAKQGAVLAHKEVACGARDGSAPD